MKPTTQITEAIDIVAIEREARIARSEATAEMMKVLRTWISDKFAPAQVRNGKAAA